MPAPSTEWPAIAGALEQIQPLKLLLVPPGRSALSRQWNQLLDQFHYLGAGPLCGAQLRYLVRCSQGPVAALAFSAAAWQVAGRDRWIGWSAQARRENLHRVVNNSRWLILPQVRVPNLASQVLGRVLAVLPEHWQQRYGYTPVLVESFARRPLSSDERRGSPRRDELAGDSGETFLVLSPMRAGAPPVSPALHPVRNWRKVLFA